MINYANILKNNNIQVNSFLEIGSRDGHDAKKFADQFDNIDVNIIEPAPNSYRNIISAYPSFSVFNIACSDKSGRAKFNNITRGNIGASSLMDREYYKRVGADVIEVDVIRGDEFLKQNNIQQIDGCKIDTEGHTYEVLKGFGDELSKIKSMHIEAEMVEVWDGQVLYNDIKTFLEEKEYKNFYFIEYNHPTIQSDSIWIHSSVL